MNKPKKTYSELGKIGSKEDWKEASIFSTPSTLSLNFSLNTVRMTKWVVLSVAS